MKNLLLSVIFLFSSGLVFANDCISSAGKANSRMAMILDDAEEYFRFGKYTQADVSLSRAFQTQACGKKPLVSLFNVDDDIRKDLIVLNALNLWEKKDHNRLLAFTDQYLDKRTGKAWECRVHLYEENFKAASECFYSVGEFRRYQRDLRATEITRTLQRSDLNGG